MAGQLIDVFNLKKIYYLGDVVTSVLNGLTFTIERGEFVAIMGPSGSGKSTLMHILSFLDSPTSGQYQFCGQPVAARTSDELADLRNQEVGFVFQSFHLLPKISVADNVKLPLLYSRQEKLSDSQMNQKVAQAIEEVGLSHRRYYFSNQLSGGEQQRVAIARAIVNNPAVIFADEPTGNLDSKTGEQILQIFQAFNSSGRTIVMVTHAPDIARYAKRIIQLRDGQIVDDQSI